MTEEVKQLEEEIEAVKEKIDDDVMCEKVRQYIYAPKEIQMIFKADASTYQAEQQLNKLATAFNRLSLFTVEHYNTLTPEGFMDYQIRTHEIRPHSKTALKLSGRFFTSGVARITAKTCVSPS